MAKGFKTEHSGAKNGGGAFWGYRSDAKKLSNKARRANGKREARETRES
jgi:hypothetical protein